MRTPTSAFALALVSLSLGAAGCGNSATSITISGQTLNVAATSYGQDSRFCDNLANGQYQVILTDFGLCSELQTDAGNAQIFHSMTETNLRIIFPSFLKVPPNVNSFQVGRTNNCTHSDGPVEAMVVFEHQTGNSPKYDLEVEADSGTITVTSSPDEIKNLSEMKGSYDVMIAGSHLTGSFDAILCKGIVAGVGQ